MIPYSHWMGLKLSTRIKIAEELNIPKLRSTHVANDQVLDDGYNIKDVEEAIKVVPLQTYLKSTETDVFKLFDELVLKAEGRYIEPVKEEVVTDKTQKQEKPKKVKKLGAKKAKSVKKKKTGK